MWVGVALDRRRLGGDRPAAGAGSSATNTQALRSMSAARRPAASAASEIRAFSAANPSGVFP